MGAVWRALTKLQPALLVLAFGAMGLLLARRWDALAGTEWHVRPGWLALSGVLLVAGWVVELGIWQRALAWFGGRLGFGDVVTTWFASAVVRYLPGNVWQPLSLTVRCQALGIRPVVTIAGASLLHILNVAGTLLVMAIYIAYWGVPAGVPVVGGLPVWWAAVPAAPAAILLVWPGLVVGLANRALVAFGYAPFPPGLTRRRIASGLAVNLAMWALLASAFAAFVMGVARPAGAPGGFAAAQVAAAYPIAYVIGFLSFITPSGIGVREGVLYTLVAPLLGPAPALVASLAMRAWELALELAIALLVVVRRPRRAKNANEAS